MNKTNGPKNEEPQRYDPNHSAARITEMVTNEPMRARRDAERRDIFEMHRAARRAARRREISQRVWTFVTMAAGLAIFGYVLMKVIEWRWR